MHLSSIGIAGQLVAIHPLCIKRRHAIQLCGVEFDLFNVDSRRMSLSLYFLPPSYRIPVATDRMWLCMVYNMLCLLSYLRDVGVGLLHRVKR